MLPFTIFTPTYNRAHTLRRVFDSLCKQPTDLFEWLVVDDGSSDGTTSLLEELIREAPFRVRTVRQPNGGKHRAHNTALALLDSELTIILDSDDELAFGALEILWTEWQRIPTNERQQFAALIGHSADADGQLEGRRFPASRVDGHHFELSASGAMFGEKLPCYRTEVLRRFPFPERPGDNSYVPEGVVWVPIGEEYVVRCIDQVVRVYHRDLADPHAVMNRFLRPSSNAWGRMQYAITILNLSAAYWPRHAYLFARTAAGYVRYALHCGVSVADQRAALHGALARTLWGAALPVGALAWLRDRRRG